MPKNQTLYYVDLNPIKLGAMLPYNIVGYHTSGRNQTKVFLKPAPTNLQRLKASDFHARKDWIPLTSLKSGVKTLKYFISNKIIPGETFTIHSRQHIQKDEFLRNCAQKGLVPVEKAILNSQYMQWRAQIRKQIKEILNDKAEFVDESRDTEALRDLKRMFRWIRSKKGFDSVKLEEFVNQALKEHLIEYAMEK